VTVVVPMVVGFILIAAFGVWETFSNVPHKLCPPHLFRSHNGREFTAPFIVAFVVTMFYYSVNILWVSTTSVHSVEKSLTRIADHGQCLLSYTDDVSKHRAAAYAPSKRGIGVRCLPSIRLWESDWPLVLDFDRDLDWNDTFRSLDGLSDSRQSDPHDSVLLYQR
jgi:hypothetical protein